MNNPITKNLLLGGIPTIISAIGIIMMLDILSSHKEIFIILTIILLIIFMILVAFYAKYENNERNSYEKIYEESENLKTTITSINKLLGANSSIVTSMVELLEPWTTNINKIANDIYKNGKANEKDWDYNKMCTDICISCKNVIKQFVGGINDTDISVALIKYYTENDKEYVRMISHSSPQTAKPDIFDVPELLAGCNYQYARIIKDKRRGIFVLESKEKIRTTFHRKHPETDLSKYSQYLAIPVVCSKNKYLGILQVTIKYDNVIMESETDLKKFGQTYVTPFVELVVLIDKIQKGLFITPEV